MISMVMILEILAVSLISFSMLLILNGEGSREQKLIEYFLCGSLVQNVGYILELTAPNIEAAVTAVKMEYLGSAFIPLCYCCFLYRYCYRKPPRRLFAVMGAINVVMLVFVYTCERHTLFYNTIRWVERDASHGYLWLEYGPLYALFFLNWIVVPFVLALSMLAGEIRQQTVFAEKRKYLVILVMSVLPIIVFIAHAMKLTESSDPTPLTLGICMSIVVIFIWSRRNYDFRHLASDAVLSSMSDGVIAIDGQRRLIYYNGAALNIFPQLAQHRIGEQIADIKNFDESLLEENTAHTLEVGGRYFESHAKQIRNEDNRSQGYVVLLLDITDTRNYIEEIMRVRRQAEQANVAKSEFLANMSHEIRTPMNAIIGLSDLIMEESRGRKVYGYAHDVQSSAKNLLAIINDILDLSKVEAGKMELVLSEYRIKTLVGEILGMMDIAASQRGLLMKHEYDLSIPCGYRGDEGRIKQILINLLSNAIKFTRKGHVKLCVDGKPGTSPDEELIIFRVEDTGCGIKKEDQEKIFEDFKQVDSKRNRSVEGTGLGLSITRHLVALMNGSIELESEYGKGSVFTVTIPQPIVDRRSIKDVPDEELKEAERINDFTAPGIKVLIVDDNKVNRKVANGFLAPYGLELAEASNGMDAIEMVKNTRYDIIFMDHMMPEMDGIEAAQHIRGECGENGRTAIIVGLTANAMQGTRERFLDNGFQDFITKPLERKPLHDLLKRWIPEECRQKKAEEKGADNMEGMEEFHINGLDSSVAAQYGAVSAGAYRQILSLYCLEGKQKMVLLRELFEKEDIGNFEIEVHGLKSASANIGAMALSARAKELEIAARGGDWEAVSDGFPALMDAYGEQLADIQAFLDEEQAQSGEERLAALDREELIGEVESALDLLENFRSRECAGKVEKLLTYQTDEETTAKLKEIQEQLKLFEDDNAEALLRQLLEHIHKEA